MTKKNKYATIGLIIWLLAFGIGNALYDNPGAAMFYGIAAGAYAMFYIYENYKNVRTSVPQIYIKTEDYIGLAFIIPQYEAMGYQQTAYWATWKYFIFGQKTYHVEMNRPEGYVEELTDDQLIKQERFEELAERKKKREQNN